MSNRLWSDISPSSGHRFWAALASSPGIISPATAALRLDGREPIANQPGTIFRSPAFATLTLLGLNSTAPVVLSPVTGAVSAVGQIPSRQLIRIISPVLPAPDYSTPPSNAPTIVYIQTKTPATALLTLLTLEINVTEGGNIGFISPAAAQLSLVGQSFTLLYGEAGVGTLQIIGLTPTVLLELTIAPEAGQVSTLGQPVVLSLPFQWIDDDPSPPTPWIRDAAA